MKLNISAVLLFIAFFARPVKGIRSSCTSIEAKEGDTVNLKFSFDGDIKTPKLDVIIRIKINSTTELSIKVVYFGDELHVKSILSEVEVYANETNALTLKIRKVTKEYSGNYSAFVHGSDISEVTPCILTVKESHGKSGVGSHTSAVITSCATLISTLILIFIFE